MNTLDNQEHPILCRSNFMKSFLNFESASTLTKVCKGAGLDTNSVKGRERMFTPEDARKILEFRKFNLSQDAKVIAFWVNKGGVGKTSISKLTAVHTASLGFKVLYIDTDSQGNSTDSFHLEEYGYDINEETLVLSDVFDGKANIKDCILQINENLSVMPSTIINQNITEQTIRKIDNNTSKVFKKIVEPVKGEYDYIFIDCAPNLGLLNMSIACAADMTMLMAHPHSFSMKAIRQTTDTLNELEESFNIKIPRRIIYNRYAKKMNLTHKVMSDLVNEFSELLIQPLIEERADVANAIDYNHNFYVRKNYVVIGPDEKPKKIVYKDSPQDFSKLTNNILSLPELTLEGELQTIH